MKEKTHLHKNKATMVSKKAKSDETLYWNLYQKKEEK